MNSNENPNANTNQIPSPPQSPGVSGGSRGSGALRVCQLRVEGAADAAASEAQHERTVQSQRHISEALSQSWEDLTLVSQEGSRGMNTRRMCKRYIC